MKNIVIILLFCFLASTGTVHPRDYFVSLDGNDSWSGELADPNSDKTDGPFRTIEKARDTIRALKKASGLPADGVTVSVRGGMYQYSWSFMLTAEDSGMEDNPIVWRAYPGEDVLFMGGKYLNGFEPVTEDSILTRLNENCRDNILQFDLAGAGIKSIAGLNQSIGAGLELYYSDEAMTLARYPNDDFLKINSIPLNCETPFVGDPRTVRPDGTSNGMHCGKFTYSNPLLPPQNQLKNPENWAPSDDIWMFGYWYVDWSFMFQKVESIDTKKKEIYMTPPYHFYGYKSGQRYYFLNVLEELDSPGEYYIDRTNKILYFYPPGPISENDVYFSTSNIVTLVISNAENILIQGFRFEGMRKGVITVSNGSNVVIDGCKFRNVGGDYAVLITNGTNHGIINCEMYDLAGGGVKITGGDRKTLTPAGHYAINNHVHLYSKVIRTYRSAIGLYGVGNRISNNYIHDAPHEGVRFEGNELVLEYNEVTRVAQETGDVPAFGTAYDWTYCGNIIRYNYFHNIHGPGLYGCMTLYFDLPAGGTWIYGNIFNDVDWGFYTNSGRDCIIENNVFYKANPAIGFTVWRDPEIFLEGGDWRVYERLMEMNYKEPPYSERYPNLLKLFEDGDPAIPQYNAVRRNISAEGQFLNFYTSGIDFSIIPVENNLIADPVIFKGYIGDKNLGSVARTDKNMTDLYEQYGNRVISNDPGFIDAANGNFELRQDSPAWALGFERIPIEKIGLLKDETPVKVEEKPATAFTLEQNSPNPFNPVTTIRFTLPKPAEVKLMVYNMLGQEVALLVNGRMTAGMHRVVFNGGSLASGIYLYRLVYGNVEKTKKMLLVK